MDKKIKASYYKSDDLLKLYIGRRLIKEFDLSSHNLKESNYNSWFSYKFDGDNNKTRFDIIFDMSQSPRLYIYPFYGEKVLTKDPIDVTIKN